MTFDSGERSQDEGAPVGLFLFVYGPLAEHRFAYTDNHEPIEHGGVRYLPEAIGRGDIEIRGDFQAKPLVLRISSTTGLANYFKNRTFEQDIRLTIRTVHVTDGDPDYPVIWTGRVYDSDSQGPFVEMQCRALISGFEEGGIGRRYQRGCPWALYSTGTPDCNAVRRIRGQAAPVRVGRNAIVLGAGWHGALDPAKFIGGYLTWQGGGFTYARTIIKTQADSEGTILVLQGNTAGLTTSSRVTLYAGCNHLPDDCKDLHDNILNYGGQPHIPLKHPINRVYRFGPGEDGGTSGDAVESPIEQPPVSGIEG